MKAAAYIDEHGVVIVPEHNDSEFLDHFKSTVKDWTTVPVIGGYRVTGDNVPLALSIFRIHYPYGAEINKAPDLPNDTDQDYRTLYLRKGAPRIVVKAAADVLLQRYASSDPARYLKVSRAADRLLKR